jgi:glycerol-3-phosphate dehydrogenase (NAD(P)+)
MGLFFASVSMANTPKVAVLGQGAWGMILADLVQSKALPLIRWQRSQGSLCASGVLQTQVVISALPMKAVRAIAEQLAAVGMAPGTIIVSATKGLEPQTAKTAAQIWQELLPEAIVVVLSGPNLAAEIAQGLPAATVVAGPEAAAVQVQAILAASTFRVYTNTDSRGVELGGILKNVMAIACGANDGLRLGVNSRSALITRGLVEMVRVGEYWGGSALTLYGLSGLGDMLATCTSPLSRNYQMGWKLAEGKSPEQALAEIVGTVEGVNTAQVLTAYAQVHGLEVPITQEVCAVLQGQHSPIQAIANLLERPAKPELGTSE